ATEMEMGVGEDKRFDSKRRAVLDLWQLFARGANGFTIFSCDVQELESVASIIEVAKFRKHAHRRLASRNDELQPDSFLRDQWLGQRCSESAESDIDSGAGEFDLLGPAEVLNSDFNSERKPLK